MNSNNDTTGKDPTGQSMTKRSMYGWTFANACILGVCAWMVFTQGGSLVRRADAGTPPVSAANMQRAPGIEPMQALDSGSQRAEMVSELRALRAEMSQLRSQIAGGVRAEVTNLGDMKVQIDYAKLRDAAAGK